MIEFEYNLAVRDNRHDLNPLVENGCLDTTIIMTPVSQSR